MKQRNVIEWLEGELSSNKEDKLKSQNQMMSTMERINYLLNRDSNQCKLYAYKIIHKYTLNAHFFNLVFLFFSFF